MSAVANQIFRLGETWVMDATCHDSLGNALGLSGAAIKWRLSLNGAEAMDAAVGSGIATVNGGTAGEILITITPAMQIAAGLAAGYYRHQCRVTLSDGVTVTDQFAGSFKVLPSLF
jgi:hypothetical protein